MTPLVADGSAITLVLGGARSGKSSFAQELASATATQVLFVATGVATDMEMASRIAAHRATRPADWGCIEATRGVGRAVYESATAATVVLVDCLSFLVSNCLLERDDPSADHGAADGESAAWPEVEKEIDDLLSAVRSRRADLIVVSNEVGMSLVPEYPLGRLYRDLLGRANQQVAAAADAVYLLVAGIPLTVKTPGGRSRHGSR